MLTMILLCPFLSPPCHGTLVWNHSQLPIIGSLVNPVYMCFPVLCSSVWSLILHPLVACALPSSTYPILCSFAMWCISSLCSLKSVNPFCFATMPAFESFIPQVMTDLILSVNSGIFIQCHDQRFRVIYNQGGVSKIWLMLFSYLSITT